jgi:DivIVA domain-containing protein
MTPDDIRSQRFSTRFLQGFSPEEVSAFLEDVADAFDEVQKTSASLTGRVKELENELRAVKTRPTTPPPPPDTLRTAQAQAESLLRAAQDKQASASSHIEILRTAALREVEALLHDAQAQAQTILDGARERQVTALRDAETVKARLQAAGEEIVAGAAATAEGLVASAKEQEAAIRDEIERLTQSRLQLVDESRGTLDTYHGWLASVDPRGRARGRREAPEASNGSSDGVDAPDEARAV